MGKIVRTSILIFDDFKNVLVAERGKGKNTVKTWGIFGKELKGKEDEEKAISKAVDKDIKCTIFELKQFKQYPANEGGEEILQVFTGNVKEYITTHRTINSVKWIGKNEVDNYNFSEEDKMIINDFFNN